MRNNKVKEKLEKFKSTVEIFLSNKKAFISHDTYWSNWAELFFLVLLFVGLIFGVATPSAFITYLVGFFSGALGGRFLFERKEKGKAPYVLIVIGFVLGYIIGTFHGNRIITLLLFLTGAILTYYLFSKGILKDTFI